MEFPSLLLVRIFFPTSLGIPLYSFKHELAWIEISHELGDIAPIHAQPWAQIKTNLILILQTKPHPTNEHSNNVLRILRVNIANHLWVLP